MSLVKTLGRMAVGVLLAKGVGKMMGGGQGVGHPGGARPGGAQSGGLGGLLGGLLGGGSSGGGTTSGGLGGALGGALGGSGGSGGGALGDLGALLGGKGGAAGGAAGGLGGLLESIGGGRSNSPEPSYEPSRGSFGGLLNSALQGERTPEPDDAQEALAKVMIRAMIGAAKADGEIDRDEQQRIVSHLGDDVTEEERRFVIAEMHSPLDLDGLVASVPKGAEAQVYMMSLMGIELDTQEEARYLDSLRQKLGLSEQACNDIHTKLGVPTLYG